MENEHWDEETKEKRKNEPDPWYKKVWNFFSDILDDFFD